MQNTLLPLMGVSAIALSVLSGLYIVMHYPNASTESISAHIADHRNSFVMMGVVLSVCCTMFYGFITLWFIPTFQLNAVAYGFTALAFLGQFFVAWVPLTKKRRANGLINPHFIGGFFVALSMPSLLLLALIGNYALSNLQHLLLLALTTICAALFVPMIITIARNHRTALYIEAFFLLSFFAGILVLTWPHVV